VEDRRASSAQGAMGVGLGRWRFSPLVWGVCACTRACVIVGLKSRKAKMKENLALVRIEKL